MRMGKNFASFSFFLRKNKRYREYAQNKVAICTILRHIYCEKQKYFKFNYIILQKGIQIKKSMCYNTFIREMTYLNKEGKT